MVFGGGSHCGVHLFFYRPELMQNNYSTLKVFEVTVMLESNSGT